VVLERTKPKLGSAAMIPLRSASIILTKQNKTKQNKTKFGHWSASELYRPMFKQKTPPAYCRYNATASGLTKNGPQRKGIVVLLPSNRSRNPIFPKM
jgi:hypothetical protein